MAKKVEKLSANSERSEKRQDSEDQSARSVPLIIDWSKTPRVPSAGSPSRVVSKSPQVRKERTRG